MNFQEVRESLIALGVNRDCITHDQMGTPDEGLFVSGRDNLQILANAGVKFQGSELYATKDGLAA